jgi:hypothetical protein
VSSVRYELSFYIPEDGILHSHRREDLKSYTTYMTLDTYTALRGKAQVTPAVN